MELQTERLEIRPFTENDRAALAALLSNRQIGETYMLPDFQSEAEALPLADRLTTLSQSRKRMVLGMFRETRLIGFLNDVEIHGDDIELGYVVDPRYWNCGYATEALRGVIGALFAHGFHRVTAGAFAGNEASLRVMRKCGMTSLGKQEVISYRGVDHLCVYCGIENRQP